MDRLCKLLQQSGHFLFGSCIGLVQIPFVIDKIQQTRRVLHLVKNDHDPAKHKLPEELFFINNDYGGPYWDKSNPTAVRSYANSPHKFVDKWDTPILIVTGEYDFRIPYTQSLEAFTAARLHGIDRKSVV